MPFPTDWNAESFDRFSREVEWRLCELHAVVQFHVQGIDVNWIAFTAGHFKDFLATNPDSTPRAGISEGNWIKTLSPYPQIAGLEAATVSLLDDLHQLQEKSTILEPWLVSAAGGGAADMATWGHWEEATAHGLAITVGVQTCQKLCAVICCCRQEAADRLLVDNL
jgi:hypothetical protein